MGGQRGRSMDFHQTDSDSIGSRFASVASSGMGKASQGKAPGTLASSRMEPIAAPPPDEPDSVPNKQTDRQEGQQAATCSLFALWADRKNAQPAATSDGTAQPPVQRQAAASVAGETSDEAARGGGSQCSSVQTAAAAGFTDTASTLPHLEQIQKSFGPSHDLSGVQAHIGGAAAAASAKMGANGYASGNRVAFKQAPSLHLAAHEAAHIVQQRAGVQLSSGVGRVGDVYERNADAIADRVVQGQSAAELLPGGDSSAAKGEQSCGCQGAGCASCGKLQQGARGSTQDTGATHGAGALDGAVQLQPAPFDCKSLLEEIIQFLNKIKQRYYELIEDKRGLQWDHWSVGDAHPEYGSVEGHQQQYRNWQQGLRKRLNDWNTNNCGDGLPGDAWEWASRPAPNPAPRARPVDNTNENLKTGAKVVGAGLGLYLLYRGVRMLPSLLPPLWWTIPANAAIP